MGLVSGPALPPASFSKRLERSGRVGASGLLAGASFRGDRQGRTGRDIGRELFEKKPLTGESLLHIWPFTDGARHLPDPFASLLTETRCPGSKREGEARRLFDIVGLDEGTCGRRPRSPAASRRWMIG